MTDLPRMDKSIPKSLLIDNRGPGMPFMQRLGHLLRFWLSGPLLGIVQKLIVADQTGSALLAWLVLPLLGMLLLLLPPLLKFAFLLVSVPILIYVLAPVPQIVFEYRSYISIAGLAILVAYSLEHHPQTLIPLLLLLLLYALRSHERARLFSSSSLFWKQASKDCPDPTVISSYIYQLNRQGNFSEVDRVTQQMLENRIPDSRTLLINLAVRKFGGREMWDQVNPQTLQESIRLLEEVTTRWPDYCDGWRNLGTVLYYAQQPQKAITAFSMALKLDLQDSSSWLGVGECHRFLGEWTQAVNDFRMALELSPQVDYIRARYMEALEVSGQMKEFKEQQRIMGLQKVYYVTDENAPFVV